MNTKPPRFVAVALATAIAVVGIVFAVPSGATTKPKPKPGVPPPPMSESVTQTYYLAAGERFYLQFDVSVAGDRFAVPSWARYVSVAVSDASSLPTAGEIWYLSGWSTETYVASFCGRTTQSYPVTPADTVWVSLDQGPCGDGTVAAGTTGTVTVTFTN